MYTGKSETHNFVRNGRSLNVVSPGESVKRGEHGGAYLKTPTGSKKSRPKIDTSPVGVLGLGESLVNMCEKVNCTAKVVVAERVN